MTQQTETLTYFRENADSWRAIGLTTQVDIVSELGAYGPLRYRASIRMTSRF
jgi:hypothetical protein